MSSLNPDKRHIILIGFRGVGKSVIASLLKDKLNYPLFDSDNEIVKDYGKPIPKIFEEDGENCFRSLEEKIIKQICLIQHPVILSTGGGAILSPKNRLTLKENGFVILLSASEETIFNRIKDDKNRPPLTDKGFREEISYILNARQEFYQETKDIEINTTHLSPDEIVNSIVSFLKNMTQM
ncbi:MAG: shikimate kinase [Spirochaetota bacterium]|nr:shikimate kinase [Spirochaetota bacterium]